MSSFSNLPTSSIPTSITLESIPSLFLAKVFTADVAMLAIIFPPLVMHWIGYIYRYWSYTEQISTMKLIQRVTINYLAGIYEAYHSLSPEQVVSHIKETLDLDEEKRRERVIQKFKLIYQSRL